jgi:hypothetical protein
VAGATFDTNIMEDVHYVETDRARLPAKGVLLIVAFGLVTALLLWMAGNDKGFALMLDVFFLYNIFGVLYILKFMKPITQYSMDIFRRDRKYISLVQLQMVSHYMRGPWQRQRFLSVPTITGTERDLFQYKHKSIPRRIHNPSGPGCWSCYRVTTPPEHRTPHFRRNHGGMDLVYALCNVDFFIGSGVIGQNL